MITLRRGTPLHKRVVRMIRNRVDTCDIVRQIGCRAIQVSAIKAHLTMGTYRRKPRTSSGLNDKVRQRIVRMIRNGVDLHDIARKLKMTIGRIAAIKAHCTMGTYA